MISLRARYDLTPLVLVAVLELADDVGEERSPGVGDFRRVLLAELLLPDVDDGAREHVEVVGQEALDGDVPSSSMVTR